jgi:hypothetical protein
VDEQELRMDEREVRGKVGGGEEGGVKRLHITYATACRARKRGLRFMLDNRIYNK